MSARCCGVDVRRRGRREGRDRTGGDEQRWEGENFKVPKSHTIHIDERGGWRRATGMATENSSVDARETKNIAITFIDVG